VVEGKQVELEWKMKREGLIITEEDLVLAETVMAEEALKIRGVGME
jgi:hypothetical protein